MKMNSSYRTRQQHTKWTSDHIGRGDKSSMGVLLDWLATPGNYDRWRHCTHTGESHRPLADEILRQLHAEGLVHRTAIQVQAKISELEKSYREAAEHLASTKEELQAQGTSRESDLHRVLARHCHYFALLQPIMKDLDHVPESQPLKRPKLTTKRKTSTPSLPNAAQVKDSLSDGYNSPSPLTGKKNQYQLRERQGLQSMSKDIIEDIDNKTTLSVGGTTGLSSLTKLTTKTKEGKRLEVENTARGLVRCRPERPKLLSEPLQKRSKQRSIDEIDLEKAKTELLLGQLELQMVRDRALVTRVRAQTQLLEQGMSRPLVNKLLPLDGF